MVISAVIFAFFWRLFLPEPSIFITPDYGRSDSWHFSIANKFYYAAELKKNRIPIWNPHIGTGYPTLAEGQTGVFFLPNLIFFRLLPFVYAYNLTLVLAFITAGAGTYLFCRSLGLNKLASTYAGTIFPLGGFFVLHVQHHNLLQTATLMPLLFWAGNEFLNKKRVIFLLALSFVVSQQIFAGFPQLTFYSLVALTIYTVLKVHLEKTQSKFKIYSLLLASMIFGLTLSAIQLLPSYELLKVSTKQSDPKSILTQFPYTAKNLLQFLDPFILGSPKDASYPRWTPGSWGIFWENTAYIGILPLALSGTILFASLYRKRRRKITLPFLTLLFVSILLSLGKNSPLQIVYSVFPFSVFRVPSRFLLLTQFSLVLLAAIFLEKLIKKKLLVLLILLFSIIDIFFYFYNYNPIDQAEKWFQKPEITNYLDSSTKRVYTIGNQYTWNNVFLNHGWQDNSYYYFSRNFLERNSNLIFGIDSFQYYESILPERSAFVNEGIQTGFTFKNNSYDLADSAIDLLAASQITHIISPYEIKSDNLKKITGITSDNDEKIYLYKINKNTPMYTLISKFSVLSKKPAIAKKLTDPDFNLEDNVVLEKITTVDISAPNAGSIDLKQESETETIANVHSDKNSIFLARQSYYPGWQAYVDGEKTEVYAANVNSMAITIPSGQHILKLKYQPKSLVTGGLITILSYLALVVFFKFSRKLKTI